MTCEGNVCGTGGYTGPKPGDPDNDTTVLSATSAFGGIDVRWNYPTTNPHALSHVLLYRSLINNFDTALLLQRVVGEFYYDKVQPGVLYFYWIRIVSINGTTGEPIGPASAVALPLIAQMIELLTGKIDAGFLAQSLKTEIARIPEIDLKIIQEIGNRIQSNTALGLALEAVRSDVGAALTLVSNEITERTEGDTALVQAVNTIAGGVADNAAAIIEERNLRVDENGAMAGRIDTLYAQVGGVDGSVDSKIVAAIQSERTVTVGREQAIAHSVDALYAQVGQDINGAIQSEATLRFNADGALGQRIDTIAITVGNHTAAIQNTSQAIIDQGTATTQQINNMRSTIAGDTTNAINGEAAARNSAISAAVQSEAQTRVSAVQAIADSVTNVESILNGNIVQAEQRMTTVIQGVDGRITGLNGDLTGFGQRVGNAEGAINGVTGRVGTAENKIQEIGALYTVKLTVNGLGGGYGVYNDGSTVEGGWDVDSFWVGRTQANKRKPFIVENDEVFIDQAIINQLTFSKLRDESGSVIVENGKMKVEYLDVDNLTARNINVVDVDGSHININNYSISFGQAGFNIDNGFWIGRDSDGLPKFSFGAQGGNNIRWDGYNLYVQGDIITTGNLVANSVTHTLSALSPSVPYGGSIGIAIVATGAPILIVASSYGAGTYENAFLYRDGVQLWASNGQGAATISFVDQPGPGVYYYSVGRNGGIITTDDNGGLHGSNTSAKVSLALIETKR